MELLGENMGGRLLGRGRLIGIIRYMYFEESRNVSKTVRVHLYIKCHRARTVLCLEIHDMLDFLCNSL